MQVIFNNGLKLTQHDLSTGTEWRLSDGVNTCSLDYLPEESELEGIWNDYLICKMDSELCEEETDLIELEWN